MCRIRWFIALVLLVPQISFALQLRWSTGATDLTFSQNTHALLVVQADSAESLPASWVLQWIADSSGVHFMVLDSTQVCRGDSAQVDSISPPSTAADSVANLITAYFCSVSGPSVPVAYYQVELVGGSRGTLRAVALDAADSNHVIQSNEATYNAGVAGCFPPVVLRASSTHTTEQLEVTAIGVGLSSALTMTVVGIDSIWSVPLTISARSDSVLIGWADVPAALPASTVEIGSSCSAPGIALLMPDRIPIGEDPGVYVDTVLFRDPNWSSTFSASVYPKDFAFYFNSVPTGNPLSPWRGLFHLIYIRHNNNYDPNYHLGFSPDAPESLLAHAWSYDLQHWQVDKRAFLPRYGTGAWDALHVWAPSIIQIGDSTYMFYTGVDATHNQRIGYVATALLDTSDTQWSLARTVVDSAGNHGSWADSTAAGYGSQQFRDPFVIADPDSAGHYLIFMTGEDKKFGSAGYMIIGGSRNAPGTLRHWNDIGAYRATDYTHTGVTIDESPLAMRDSSGTGAWRIFLANAQYNSYGTNSTYFVTEASGRKLADTTLADSAGNRYWSTPDNLYTYLGSDNSLVGWQACEHLQVGRSHFFAAFNGDGVGITQTHWDPTTGRFVIGYPSLAGVGKRDRAGGVRFYLSQLRPGVPAVRFAVELPTRMSPRLVLYDVEGRRVRILTDGSSVLGQREYAWDCRDGRGVPVASGMYFARLTGVGAAWVLRVPIVR